MPARAAAARTTSQSTLLAKGGGVVRRPTLALIGEAGPEAVVRLNRYNGHDRAGTVTVNVDASGAFYEDYASMDRLADKVGRAVVRGAENRRAPSSYAAGR